MRFEPEEETRTGYAVWQGEKTFLINGSYYETTQEQADHAWKLWGVSQERWEKLERAEGALSLYFWSFARSQEEKAVPPEAIDVSEWQAASEMTTARVCVHADCGSCVACEAYINYENARAYRELLQQAAPHVFRQQTAGKHEQDRADAKELNTRIDKALK